MIICKICENTFGKARYFYHHLIVKHNVDFLSYITTNYNGKDFRICCRICGKLFFNSKALMLHVKQIHKLNKLDYSKNYLGFVGNKCFYERCCNLVEKPHFDKDGNIKNAMFCCQSCQRKGRDKSAAFGNNDADFIVKRSAKMAATKRIVNKNRDKSEFDVFKMFINKYGFEEAVKREEARRTKEWNTKLQKILNDCDYKGFTQSDPEILFLQFLSKFFTLKIPTCISGFIIDAYIKELDYYFQCDGIFYHGLNRNINEVKNLAETKGKLYKSVYNKFLRDRRLDLYCIENNIKLCRLTDIEITSCLNSENCWKVFTDQDAIIERNLFSFDEKLTMNALKNLDIRKSAAELLKQNCYGEGSTTIETTNSIINYLERSRVDFIDLLINKIEAQSTNKISEDIVYST